MATTKAVKASDASKLSYKDMIKSAITTLKERNGSSRQALKKYVQSNYKITSPTFDSLFNAALRKGVETGDFLQPKGPSGPVKVSKKETVKAKVTKPKTTKAKPAAKKAVAKAPKKEKTAAPVKKTVTKKKATTSAKAAAPKKAATPKKTSGTTTKKAAAPKKADAPKKTVSKTSSKVKKPTTTKKVAKK